MRATVAGDLIDFGPEQDVRGTSRPATDAPEGPGGHLAGRTGAVASVRTAIRPRSATATFLWPGYRENLRPLLWLLQLKNGEVTGRETPVGIVPHPLRAEP
jgi:hypothetical protein